MDLNQLYFDQQISLMRAQDAATPAGRRDHAIEAARIAGQIRHHRHQLQPTAACGPMARSGERPA